MGKLKQGMLNDYLYCKENGLPVWRPPVSAKKAVALRNTKQHRPEPDWHEEMPDITGQALADAQHEFDDMPLWIQLELDLWEGKNGINEQTYWDMAGRGSCG